MLSDAILRNMPIGLPRSLVDALVFGRARLGVTGGRRGTSAGYSPHRARAIDAELRDVPDVHAANRALTTLAERLSLRNALASGNRLLR